MMNLAKKKGKSNKKFAGKIVNYLKNKGEKMGAFHNYLLSNGYGGLYIADDMIIRDKEFRINLIREYVFEIINAIEKCIADKSRIISDTTEKTYRKREYERYSIYYPNEVIKKYPYFEDSRLAEYIYYTSSISYIYHLKYLEFINNHKEEERLFYLNLIYPAKMPTKDYFPFIEFDLGTKIPIMLTEEEKERYKKYLDDYLSFKIQALEWEYCILWIDKDRMFMRSVNFGCNDYYFKQVGKNVHLFELTYQCV